MFALLVLLLPALAASTTLFSPTIQLNSTRVIGHYKISASGRRYEAYEGVPYAQPPTGDLRFEHPRPIVDWPRQIVANRTRDLCLQLERKPFVAATGNLVGGDEDCLYLNIYAPLRRKCDDTELRPIVFYIHGGAFMYGGSIRDGSYYLVDRGVIFVSVYYRLGVLGFLSTGDDVLPGNLGLKDQALALRWIRDNAIHFAGDPRRITLAGLSAGGASVHYHYLSKMSRGLFRNGISHSGTALDCWAQMERAKEKASRLAEMVGCERLCSREMAECLKALPASRLVQAEAEFMPWRMNPFSPFGPVVEPPSAHAFIDRPPIDVIDSGDAYDVAWITSVVSEEGLYPMAEYVTSDAIIREIDQHWVRIAPYLLDYYYTIPKDEHAMVAKRIREHYFADKAISRETLRALIHLVGDRMFSADAAKAAKAQAKANKSPAWFYYYSYRANFSFTDTVTNSTQDYGVSHADDVLMVIADPSRVPNRSERDMKVQADLIDIWTSIAKYNVPKLRGDVEWSSVDRAAAKAFNYLHIAGPDDLRMMERDDDFARIKFWNSIGFDENVIN